MRLNIFTCLAFVISVHSFGQEIIHEKNVLSASLDVKGNIFLGDRDGTVFMYDNRGIKSDIVYAPDRPSRVSLVDASNSLRIFIYYQDLQEYVILDRFLTETARYSVRDFTSFAGLCAPSQNNQIWLLDLQSFALRKIDPLRSSSVISIPLEQVLDPDSYDITFLREYQNLLFMTDRTRGLYIFDNLGNLMLHLQKPDVKHFSFVNNEILMVTAANKLIRYDLYTAQEIITELDYPADFYFEADKKYYVNNSAVIID